LSIQRPIQTITGNAKATLQIIQLSHILQKKKKECGECILVSQLAKDQWIAFMDLKVTPDQNALILTAHQLD
jgi:hypothetical protein